MAKDWTGQYRFTSSSGSIGRESEQIPAEDIRRMRVRHAYSSNILRIVAGGRQRQSRRCFAWLILTKVGTNPSRGRRRWWRRWRRRPVEDRWTTSGCPSGPPKYNNSSCQSHPSRSNRFDSGRGERTVPPRNVCQRQNKRSRRQRVGRFAVSFLFSFPAWFWFRYPHRNPFTSSAFSSGGFADVMTMFLRYPATKKVSLKQIYNSQFSIFRSMHPLIVDFIKCVQ